MKRNEAELLGNDDFGLVHLVGHLREGLVAVVIPGQAHQVGHNAGKALLEAGALLPGRFYGIGIQVCDVTVQADVPKRTFP